LRERGGRADRGGGGGVRCPFCQRLATRFFAGVAGVADQVAEAGALKNRAGPMQVDVRLPGKGNSNPHGARPVHQIISMIKWIRTSRLSIKNSLSLGGWGPDRRSRGPRRCWPCTRCTRLPPQDLSRTSCRRWRSNPSGKCSQERLARGTVTSTMRKAAYPSGCARCGAGAGCSAMKYQPLYV